MFYGALNEKGRASFVMANSASDAELDIRRKLLQEKVVDVLISVSSNFFYTVTLPCTLWFLDKDKKGTEREDKVLFIDARKIFRQIDRAHRDFTDVQIEFISNIVRMYRGQGDELNNGSDELKSEAFGQNVYKDVPGLCKIVTLSEIEEQGWSLNPGRYVGVSEREEEAFDFTERLQELNDKMIVLNAKSRELEKQISKNVSEFLK
jgi:type I restriction enzyme M protein